MHLSELLVIICAASHLLGTAVGIICYNCKATNKQEKDGPCREYVESSTKTVDCAHWCKTKIEDKSELGQGVWYKRSCVEECTNEADTNGEVSFTISCCKGERCNGDEKPRPTPATTTTPAPATTTTTPAPATTTTLVPATETAGTGTTSEQTTTDGSTATENTDTTVPTTEPTTVPTTASATTTPWTATTLVPPTDGQKCYECSSFFLGSSCDKDDLDTSSVDKVFCGKNLGSCGKIVTRIGFEWLGFDISKSRGCTTLCSGKTEELEHSIFTDIYCCGGDLCNGAIPGVSRTTFFHVIITVAAAFWIRF